MSYAARLVMHLNYGSKGSTLVRELTDYPGVQIKDDFDKKAGKTVRAISFGELEFTTIQAAVDEWKKQKVSTP